MQQVQQGRRIGFHSVTSYNLEHLRNIPYPHGCSIKATHNSVWQIESTPLWSITLSGTCYELTNFNFDSLPNRRHPPSYIHKPICGLKLGVVRGSVLAWGSSYSCSNDQLMNPVGVQFLQWLLGEWLEIDLEAELKRRMREPQRHRLLNAYPMQPVTYPRTQLPSEHNPQSFMSSRNKDRPLLIGVLPHPFCNPKERGCGFCTFPHEQFTRKDAEAVGLNVIKEITLRFEQQKHLQQAPCDAIYFGGATANLTSPEIFSQILSLFKENLTLEDPEVTLEGVPIYFKSSKGAQLLDNLCTFTRRPRISMGIQTFNTSYIDQMGRKGFGDAKVIQEVIQQAQKRGITTSGDFLIDLPNQSLAMIEADLRMAIDMGLDQICIYHLVLFSGLGTTWSRDQKKLDQLPSNEQAGQHWEWVCRFMAEQGYVQTTLTNFERQSCLNKNRGFLYERKEMEMAKHDFVGFGPCAITRLKRNDLLSGFTVI